MKTADPQASAAGMAKTDRLCPLEVESIRDALAAHLSDHLELPLEESRLTVDHLIRTEQCGKHDHGLIRVHYLITSQKFGPYAYRAAPELEQPVAGRLHLDGSGYLGYPILDRFVRRGCQIANERGLCVGTTRGVYPSGALLDWAHQAVAQNVGVIMTASSPPRVAAPTGSTPIVGTNPICIGLPHTPHPFVADSSTSEINHGQLLLARASDQSLPQHAAVDSAGQPTTDPHQVDPTKGLGALLPVGGSHKSFALAVAVELLSSLGGGQPGSSNLADCGVFCVFLGEDLTQTARQSASRWLTELDDSGTRIPGWHSHRHAEAQRKQGVVRIRPDTHRMIQPWLSHS